MHDESFLGVYFKSNFSNPKKFLFFLAFLASLSSHVCLKEESFSSSYVESSKVALSYTLRWQVVNISLLSLTIARLDVFPFILTPTSSYVYVTSFITIVILAGKYASEYFPPLHCKEFNALRESLENFKDTLLAIEDFEKIRICDFMIVRSLRIIFTRIR